jgi:hypothetical protein
MHTLSVSDRSADSISTKHHCGIAPIIGLDSSIEPQGRETDRNRI